MKEVVEEKVFNEIKKKKNDNFHTAVLANEYDDSFLFFKFLS